MADLPPDSDPQETQEWLDALDSALSREGTQRVHYLIEALIDKARRSGAHLPFRQTTAYLNTIHANDEKISPGDCFSSFAWIVLR